MDTQEQQATNKLDIFDINRGRQSTAGSKGYVNRLVSPAVLAAVCLSLVVAMGATSVAHSNNGNGNRNGNGSALDSLPLPAQNAPGREVSMNAQERQQLSRELRTERQELQRLNPAQLRQRAEEERLAQLVLSEQIADEAQQFNNMPAVANDALSEALSWYATASRRGVPGSLPIDNLIPTPVIRVVRPSQ